MLFDGNRLSFPQLYDEDAGWIDAGVIVKIKGYVFLTILSTEGIM